MIRHAEPIARNEHAHLPGKVVGQRMAGVGAGDKALGVHAVAIGVVGAVGVLAFGAIRAFAATADGADPDALALLQLGDARSQLGHDTGGFMTRIARFHTVVPVGF